jgi:endonuclease/exonuclease/phosphatase family metal-dependent hydrolase
MRSLRHCQWRLREVSLVAVLALASACAGNYHIVPAPAPFSHPSLGVTWSTPRAAADALALSRWRAAVGQPLIANLPRLEAPSPVDSLTIVSWNMALGEGDLGALLRRVQTDHPKTAMVLLLQEVFRGGDDVPLAPLNGAFARRIRGTTAREIDDLARALGMSLYYVPSMRNGEPAVSHEDRGNAILSTLPLENFAAIELPFEKQRRVALAASVRGNRTDGAPWTLRVANAHLDNTSVKKVWIGSEFARMRQARGLRDALAGTEPLVLGGDFNTWFGFIDGAYRELAAIFPGTRVTDGRRTFIGLLRLDHLFFRVPGEWRAEFKRGESSFGSDHHPLIASITF